MTQFQNVIESIRNFANQLEEIRYKNDDLLNLTPVVHSNYITFHLSYFSYDWSLKIKKNLAKYIKVEVKVRQYFRQGFPAFNQFPRRNSIQEINFPAGIINFPAEIPCVKSISRKEFHPRNQFPCRNSLCWINIPEEIPSEKSISLQGFISWQGISEGTIQTLEFFPGIVRKMLTI